MTLGIQAQIKEGSVLGGILLVAGSCIGAGMLALPVITGIGGFGPSVAMFLLAWLFMTATGLLLLEANLTLGYRLSLVSLAEKTLGPLGKGLCWLLFLFLFYSLNVAYISASGSIVQTLVADLFGIAWPAWVGSCLFTAAFAIVLYVGVKQVDYVNRLLMIGLIASYFVLVFLGSQHIHSQYLMTHHWKYAFAALPVLIISFGFHNMIPSLSLYLKGSVKRLRLTVLIGSFIPLLVYVVWQAVMLGIIPVHGREGLMQALDQGAVATSALKAAVGSSWVSSVAQLFALFAIVTSFLAQSLSLVDFLADGLKVSKKGAMRLVLIAITLVPPALLALLRPGVFISALQVAGGFAAVILFGVMPALMVWILRRQRRAEGVTLLSGGVFSLSLVFIFAIAVFFQEATLYRH